LHPAKSNASPIKPPQKKSGKTLKALPRQKQGIEFVSECGKGTDD
jgi:hypothetical protein